LSPVRKYNYRSTVNPGEAFALLVGPWIEQLTSGYYRISPLINDLAKDNWSSAEITELHACAAKALLSKQTLTPIEVSNGLLHAILGQAGEHIMPLVIYLLSDKDDILSKLAEDLRWLILIATSSGQKILPSNPIVSIALRHLQFRVAAKIDPNSATKLADAWQKEIDQMVIDEVREGYQLLFHLETLLRIEVPFSFDVLIPRVVRVIQLLSKRGTKYEEFYKSLPLADGIKMLPLFALVRCKDYKNLRDLINQLDQKSAEIRAVHVEFLSKETEWGTYLIDGIYLTEFHSPSPQWTECINVLILTIAKAREWGITSFIDSAYHIMAAIYDEDLKDSTKAISVLDEARVFLGLENPIIEDARAMILFRQKKYAEALKIWVRILPIWKTKLLSPLLAYRKAEVCAANISDWDNVAELALEGSRVAKVMSNVGLEIGFKADNALAVWKSGNRCVSLSRFAEILNQFRLLPDANSDLFSYTLQKRIGNALQWLLNDVQRSHSAIVPEPPPGGFSNNESIDEKIKDYPLQPIDFFWMPLAEIDIEVGGGGEIYEFFKSRYAETKYPAITLSIRRLTILRSLRAVALGHLISDYIAFVGATEKFKAAMSESKDILKPFSALPIEIQRNEAFYDSLIDFLCPSVLIYLRRDRSLQPLVDDWREDAKNNQALEGELGQWLEFLKQSKEKTEEELISMMCNPSAFSGERFISALLLSLQGKSNPDLIFYSNLLLFVEFQLYSPVGFRFIPHFFLC
jgi:hypothetical protein